MCLNTANSGWQAAFAKYWLDWLNFVVVIDLFIFAFLVWVWQTEHYSISLHTHRHASSVCVQTALPHTKLGHILKLFSVLCLPEILLPRQLGIIWKSLHRYTCCFIAAFCCLKFSWEQSRYLQQITTVRQQTLARYWEREWAALIPVRQIPKKN